MSRFIVENAQRIVPPDAVQKARRDQRTRSRSKSALSRTAARTCHIARIWCRSSCSLLLWVDGIDELQLSAYILLSFIRHMVLDLHSMESWYALDTVLRSIKMALCLLVFLC